MEELFTLAEAAAILRVNELTLWRWRKAGAITCRKRGRWIRFTTEDIQQFLDKQKLEATDKKQAKV